MDAAALTILALAAFMYGSIWGINYSKAQRLLRKALGERMGCGDWVVDVPAGRASCQTGWFR